MQKPIEDSYLVGGGMLVAGEYPGEKPDPGSKRAREKLTHFLDAGVSVFVDLTQEVDPLDPYASTLHDLAAERGVEVWHEPLGIRDMGVCSVEHMRRVLDVIDGHVAQRRRTYVHCWGEVGRTGMVVGCWLVRRGADGEEALRQVQAMFETMSESKVRRHSAEGSPQTEPQREMVRRWARNERGRAGDSGAASAP